MNSRERRGKCGEDYTAAWLAEHGWDIAARNYRVKGGEIDIVAEKDGVLAFVEVKTRKFGSLVSGLEAIDKRKQSHISAAADRYISDSGKFPSEIRFDAAEITVTTEEEPRVIGIEYYENAFYI